MFYNYPDQSLGGGKEDRTPDPLLAKQVLSQLSYTPNCHHEVFLFFLPSLNQDLVMVGLGRLELPTSRLSGVRSNHLSYKPLSLQLNGLSPVSSIFKRICRQYICLRFSLKGGDPAAGSPTATLLRLRPSR